MKTVVMICTICGDGGYWVAFDGSTGENRCVNHIGPQPGVCPQPCIHLSTDDSREGKTCPEHACTCKD